MQISITMNETFWRELVSSEAQTWEGRTFHRANKAQSMLPAPHPDLLGALLMPTVSIVHSALGHSFEIANRGAN